MLLDVLDDDVELVELDELLDVLDELSVLDVLDDDGLSVTANSSQLVPSLTCGPPVVVLK